MPVGRSAPPKYSRNWTMVAACASSRCSPLGHRDDLRGLGPSSPSRGELPLIEGPVTKDEVPLLARVALVEHTPGVGAGDSAREVAEDGCLAEVERPAGPADRKSTRLNSSHLVISYAVFCLKKKTI